MNRFQQSLPLACGILLAAGIGLGVWHFASEVRTEDAAYGDVPSSAPETRLFSSIPDQPPRGPAPLEPQEPVGVRVTRLVNEWRNAIIHKDAEAVERLDRIFAAHPAEFIPALMSSAEGDPEERVRSFSTRVLGKLRPPESTTLMRKLLDDRSEYVRFNAAWALGELGDRDAASRLRRLQKNDPSPNVRRSADESLRRMDGG